jgi:hypothetical protein
MKCISIGGYKHEPIDQMRHFYPLDAEIADYIKYSRFRRMTLCMTQECGESALHRIAR